jgi:IS5 family transposase
MVLRLLLLKHVRNWSYDALEREVRANLAYRDFCRIGLGKVPDAKTLARIGQAITGEVIADLHRRLVELAREKGAVEGRKMRVERLLWKRTSITRPIRACWATERGS